MEETESITGAAVTGINSLYHYGALVTLLVLVCLGLSALAAYFIRRSSYMQDEYHKSYIRMTEVMAEFKEVLRNVTRT